MKISFEKNSLMQSISIVLKAVPSKTTLPILECIHIDATTDVVKFTTNDMELGIKTNVKGEIIEKGSTAINAKIFNDIVRKLPNNTITLTVDDKSNANIKCGNSNFNIPCHTGDDFPDIPSISQDKSMTISQFVFKEAINKTIFSIAPNDNNKLMTGELIDIKDGNMRIVGLDGHRIAIRNIKVECEENYNVIVPGKTLIEVSRIISSNLEDNMQIYFNSNNILFNFDDTIVVSRLIDGPYFSVNNFLISNYATKVKVNRKDLLDSIDRSSLLISESDKKPIIIDINDGELSINVASTLGSSSEKLDITKEGNDLKIGFNPKFMLDVLKSIDEEEVTIDLINAKSPCFIKDDEESYIYLVLPVNFTA